jgi:hypothetical protein
VLTVLKDGAMVEVATIGREGMIGVSAVLDGGRVPSCAMVQAETDTCYCRPTETVVAGTLQKAGLIKYRHSTARA